MQNKKLNFLLRKYIFLFDFGLKFPWNKNKVNAYPNLDSFFFLAIKFFLRIMSLHFTIQFFSTTEKKEIVANSSLRIQALFPAVAGLSHNSEEKIEFWWDKK